MKFDAAVNYYYMSTQNSGPKEPREQFNVNCGLRSLVGLRRYISSSAATCCISWLHINVYRNSVNISL